ncbi:LPS export ABC transporter permease LptF [Polynucleobacter sp. VK25]|jgi:lipopolysaccharide export system permease protein|uniref:LPS export ABC transporter permease LptF n=1 Tax=Polynucleobacter sp. VK25 TaxID=1758398 RepID=UPI001BFE1866|nr:LPS export ABC transporter permease LptF [Polynucleobacter sp. VK25]QWD67754.1 LPS export ABC transporter permease LptF [Polynucleobacter sp. VK25]
MIFKQALRRELSFTTGGVFLVLVTIMVTTLVIRILGFAANGAVNPEDALVLIALATLGYLAVLLTVSLFVATLIVLVRWYKDSEMIVWFASGLSVTNLIRPILQFATPLIIVIALLALFVWPWANRESTLISQRFQQRDDVSMVSSGQFKESAKAERVFFIEELDVDKSEVKNIFVADSKNGRLSIAVSSSGYIQNSAGGEKSIVLHNGRRYEGQPTQPDFRILEFDEYSTKIRSKETLAPAPRDREKTITELINEPNPAFTNPNRAELLWRIGLPLMALGLVLIAIPLAYVNPRLGNYTAMFYAVLIYLIYSNLLNLTQNFVSQGKVSVFVAIWPIHLLALLIATALIRNRINPSLKWWLRQLPASMVKK